MQSLTGEQVRSLMRRNRKTIRGLAGEMRVTMTRVRQVRAYGVSGVHYVRDWLEAIQKPSPAIHPAHAD